MQAPFHSDVQHLVQLYLSLKLCEDIPLFSLVQESKIPE